MTWKTYPERLHEAGINWKFYQNELTKSGLADDQDVWLGNFGCNPLEDFAAYNVEAYPGFALAAQDEIAELRRQIQSCNTSPRAIRIRRSLPTFAPESRATRVAITKLQAALKNCGAKKIRSTHGRPAQIARSGFCNQSGDADYHALASLALRRRASSKP